jgi:hypothetical protein
MYAGTVLKLGTKKHHDLLVDQIDSLSATGCFALTELGFGALLSDIAPYNMPIGTALHAGHVSLLACF